MRKIIGISLKSWRVDKMAADKKSFANPLVADEEYVVMQMMGGTPKKEAAAKPAQKEAKASGEEPEKEKGRAARKITWDVGRKKLPEDEKKTNRIVCVMDKNLYDKILDTAKKRHVSVSSLMCQAAAREVENE